MNDRTAPVYVSGLRGARLVDGTVWVRTELVSPYVEPERANDRTAYWRYRTPTRLSTIHPGPNVSTDEAGLQ